MSPENTKAQMRKGVLEYCILAVLAKERKYATEILNHLKESIQPDGIFYCWVFGCYLLCSPLGWACDMYQGLFKPAG